MKPPLLSQVGRRAFTLVELMVATGVASIILAGLITTAITLKNTYSACDEYYKAMSDQSRVLDHIAMDLRRAKSGSVSNTAKTLTLQMPDYINTSVTPAVARTPTISATGVVTYGSTTTNPTVVYTITGTSPNQSITRTYTTPSGASTTTSLTTLTASTEDYALSCVNPANPGSTANFSFGGVGQPASVMVNLTFRPRFTRQTLANSRAATTASITTALRNRK